MEPIKGVVKQLDPQQIPDNDFIFNQEILRKMYYYGSPFEKTWLSCAVSLGYASADFLALETQRIKNLVAEANDKHLDFMPFIGKTRTKTSVQPRSFLSPEAIHNLTDYLATLEKKNNGQLHRLLWENASNDNLNDWLKALIKKANIETYGKNVKFQSLRKFLYDTLSKMDEQIASVVTAKKTDASKITYRTSLDSECERIFKESYKLFALNGDVQGKAKAELTDKVAKGEKALIDSQIRLATLETTNEALRKELLKIPRLESDNSNMRERLSEVNLELLEVQKESWKNKREMEALRKKVELLLYASEVDPEKVKRLNSLEEEAANRSYDEANERSRSEIPIKELTTDEQALFDKRVKEYKKSEG